MTAKKRRTETRRDGVVTLVTGSMGSGKTTWVRQQVQRARRMLVWDGKGIDWGADQGCVVVDDPLHLRRLIFGPAARISYRVPATPKNFELFCRMAWAWGRYKPGVLIVDEIADVTTPAKAPVAWGEIARKGRAFGLDVYVTTQRPQEADKTTQGNAAIFHCGRMSDADDQRYVARRLLGSGEHESAVAALGPMEWIERDARTMTVTRGVTRRG